MIMCPNSMARIRHDLTIDLLIWISGGNYSTGSQIIPYYHLELASRTPRSILGKGLIRVGEFHKSLWRLDLTKTGYFYIPS